MRIRLLAPGLRLQVVLLALILLTIPWVGYRYVLEMERFLREGQERALTATARAVAAALHERAALFETGERRPLGRPMQASTCVRWRAPSNWMATIRTGRRLRRPPRMYRSPIQVPRSR